MRILVFAIAVLFAVSTMAAPDWDALKVTWGLIPSSTTFKSQPRTEKEAVELGFKRVSQFCGSTGIYNGVAYVNNNYDYSLTLLYDVNGHIAGIQVGIEKTDAKKYGYPSSKIQPPFVLVTGEERERYVLTAYFTLPSKICSTGRTSAEFEREGTGSNLYIQTGNTPDHVTLIPKREIDLKAPWVEGTCAFNMGKHYWYNITENMGCDEFFPVFVVYHKGRLDTFGWAVRSGVNPRLFENTWNFYYGVPKNKSPKCLKSIGKVFSMHIYLNKNATKSGC